MARVLKKINATYQNTLEASNYSVQFFWIKFPFFELYPG